jgi:hypothetical protein
MDGVIANFSKYYKEKYGIEPRQAEKRKEFDGFFTELIANDGFIHLELMPGAMELINFLRTAHVPTQILSSTSSEKRHDAISKQKAIWLQKHGITFKQNFVPGKRFKKDWAKPDAIIIDDTESIIDDWRKAGGIAIWHKDVPTTLAQLKMYL